MRAGLLRERIALLEMVYIDTAQTTAQEWRTVHDNVPARVTYVNGSKRVEAEEVVTDFSVEFHVRDYYATIIKPNMLIEYRNMRYAILNLAVYRDRQELVITSITTQNESNE